MAKSLVPQDAYQIINLLAREATGQNATIQAVDSSSFVSVGETILATGTENVLNALSRVLGRTFMAVRPYDAKLFLINAINTEMYTERMRKISFYSKDAQASGWFNTNLYTQHANGLDNGVNRIYNGSISPVGGLGNMFEQNQAMPFEVNFSSRNVWDDSLTVYENQLKVAFRGPGEFMDFMAGIMTEKGNDIESQKEAHNRLTMLNFIAGAIDLSGATNGTVIDLKAGFNTKYGTNYTSAALLSTYLPEFTKYFVSVVKTVSEFMRIRSVKYHVPFTKTVGGESYSILRHTPRDRMRMLIYAPLMIEAEANVFSTIFNPEYLNIGQYEKVTHWQNINDPMSIDVTPAIPNLASPASGQTKGNRVQLDHVVGMIYDEDALMTDYQMDESYTTPLEARKGYRNIWWHYSKGAINDFSENHCVFILGNDS
jgi:hypothetical protein